MINRKRAICLQKCKNLAQFLRIEMKWLSILHLLRHFILKQLFNNWTKLSKLSSIPYFFKALKF